MFDCIEWKGNIRKDGRGYTHKNKKMIDCHKYIYEEHFGEVEKGLCVRRKCKNIKCVNLEHLFLQPKCIPVKDRLLNNTIIPENKNLCWVWNGSKDKDGYGYIDGLREFKERRAHRISYILHKGEFDRTLVICHSCDNPSCINPSHLWVGTTKDNNQDAFIKKRRKPQKPPIFYGKDNNKTKLTENQVLEIRDLYKNGMGYSGLAKIYPVSSVTIRAIILRKIWKQL